MQIHLIYLIIIGILANDVFAVGNDDDNDIFHLAVPQQWESFYDQYNDKSLETAISNGITDKKMLQWLIEEKNVPLRSTFEILSQNNDIEMLDYFIVELKVCGEPYDETFLDVGVRCIDPLLDAIRNGNIPIVDYFSSKMGNTYMLGYYQAYAAEEGQLEVVKYYVEKGIIADDPSGFEDTALPLDEALDHGHFHIVDYLLQQDTTAISVTTLFLAAKTGKLEYYETIKLRFEHIDSYMRGRYILNADLLSAVVTGQLLKATELLDRGADPNMAFDYSQTCLAEAINAEVDISMLRLIFTRGGLFKGSDKSESWPDLPNLTSEFFQKDEGIRFLEFYVSYLPVNLIWPFVKLTVFDYTYPYGLESSADPISAIRLYDILLDNPRFNSNNLIVCFLKSARAIMADDIKTLKEVSYDFPQKFIYLAGMALDHTVEGYSLTNIAFRMGRFRMVSYMIQLGVKVTDTSYQMHKRLFRSNGLPETEEERQATYAMETTINK